jgi:hypothetical protein
MCFLVVPPKGEFARLQNLSPSKSDTIGLLLKKIDPNVLKIFFNNNNNKM